MNKPINGRRYSLLYQGREGGRVPLNNSLPIKVGLLFESVPTTVIENL
jgi:hypothetical protein